MTASASGFLEQADFLKEREDCILKAISCFREDIMEEMMKLRQTFLEMYEQSHVYNALSMGSCENNDYHFSLFQCKERPKSSESEKSYTLAEDAVLPAFSYCDNEEIVFGNPSQERPTNGNTVSNESSNGESSVCENKIFRKCKIRKTNHKNMTMQQNSLHTANTSQFPKLYSIQTVDCNGSKQTKTIVKVVDEHHDINASLPIIYEKNENDASLLFSPKEECTFNRGREFQESNSPMHIENDYAFIEDSQTTTSFCPSKFSNLPKEREALSQTGTTEFKCSFCGRCFCNNRRLNEHERTHTGEKPFKCKLCGRCFAQASSLRNHKMVHVNEKEFKCDICGRCFSQRRSIKEHKRIHTGEKPFKCEVCGRCFARRQHLKDHTKLHTGEKPFKCDVCDHRFTVRSSLVSHVRKHHLEYLSRS